MKAKTIDMRFGPPPPMNDGVTLLLKVDGEYVTVKHDFGGYITKLGRYISPHDIDEYGVIEE